MDGGAISDGIVVDLFAGGGGASDGIVRGLGRPVDIAINHSPEAVAMHAANHPETRHYCEDIWEVDPREAVGSRWVKFLWASPDCTQFSKAKGGKPRDRNIRCLAHVVIRWARAVKPRTIILENVEEFQDWGPLRDDGKPDKTRLGEDFRAWLAELVDCGYTVDFRELVAAHYGAPTTRRRLYLVAQLRGETPIVWPSASHGAGLGRPLRTAAEIIDWSIECPSIFGRKKPLADATLRRIAAGVQRYVVGSPSPFIVPVKTWGGGGNAARGLDEPMRTVTASKRGEFGLVTPYLAHLTHHGGDRVRPLHAPAPTITGANRGEIALLAPTLLRTDNQSDGRLRGVRSVAGQLPTVTSAGGLALAAAVITKHYGGVVGHQVELPLGTVTAQDHHAVTTATLAEGDSERADEVAAFLVKFYGASGSPVSHQGAMDPLHTVTAKARFAVVTVHGVPYRIVDIGMRMLQPRELYRAQGFRDDYQIDLLFNGKPLTKTAQIALCGNSVCPPVAEALVRANATARREVAA